jgi:hypothetical protein
MEKQVLHLTLSSELRLFIEQEAAAHGLASATAYVESLVREAQCGEARDCAEQLVLEGVASGSPIIADEAIWSRLRSELNARSPN